MTPLIGLVAVIGSDDCIVAFVPIFFGALPQMLNHLIDERLVHALVVKEVLRVRCRGGIRLLLLVTSVQQPHGSTFGAIYVAVKEFIRVPSDQSMGFHSYVGKVEISSVGGCVNGVKGLVLMRNIVRIAKSLRRSGKIVRA